MLLAVAASLFNQKHRINLWEVFNGLDETNTNLVVSAIHSFCNAQEPWSIGRTLSIFANSWTLCLNTSAAFTAPGRGTKLSWVMRCSVSNLCGGKLLQLSDSALFFGKRMQLHRASLRRSQCCLRELCV
jgi:hypothetical protein